MAYSDKHLRSVLTRTRVIAVVGVSANPVRPSNFVARYLGLRGYRVIGVNPIAVGQDLYGAPIRAGLADVPEADMVDIFRRPDAVPEIVEQALEVCPELQTIWMQIGVTHAAGAARAEARGLTVIQDRCPKIEHQRLFGELRKGGFATGIISSKL
ncbi:MAG: CoA-binding protein [Pseudomonadota bacterium]